MKALIEVKKHDTLIQCVSARDLYLGLGLSKDQWSRWSKTNIENNEFFKEGLDWVGFDMMSNGNEIKDYAVSIDFAKHIAMQAKTKASHDYRNYFIECEKQVVNQFKLPDFTNPAEAARAWATEFEQKTQALAVIEQQKQIIQVKDDLIRVSNEASVKAGEVLIREFVKSQDLITLGEKQFYQWMREQKLVFGENNEPYQQYVHAGYFTYKPTEKMHGGKYRHTLRVTPRGKVWLAAKYMAYLEKVGFEVPESKVRNGLVVIK